MDVKIVYMSQEDERMTLADVKVSAIDVVEETFAFAQEKVRCF